MDLGLRVARLCGPAYKSYRSCAVLMNTAHHSLQPLMLQLLKVPSGINAPKHLQSKQCHLLRKTNVTIHNRIARSTQWRNGYGKPGNTTAKKNARTIQFKFIPSVMDLISISNDIYTHKAKPFQFRFNSMSTRNVGGHRANGFFPCWLLYAWTPSNADITNRSDTCENNFSRPQNNNIKHITHTTGLVEEREQKGRGRIVYSANSAITSLRSISFCTSIWRYSI